MRQTFCHAEWVDKIPLRFPHTKFFLPFKCIPLMDSNNDAKKDRIFENFQQHFILGLFCIIIILGFYSIFGTLLIFYFWHLLYLTFTLFNALTPKFSFMLYSHNNILNILQWSLEVWNFWMKGTTWLFFNHDIISFVLTKSVEKSIYSLVFAVLFFLRLIKIDLVTSQKWVGGR